MTDDKDKEWDIKYWAKGEGPSVLFPSESTPAESTPVEPTPVEPTSAEPSQSQAPSPSPPPVAPPAGQAAVQVGVDQANRLVVVNFGQSYRWISMDSTQAKLFAQILWSHAAELDKQTLGTLDPKVIENSKVVPIFAKKKEPPS